MKLPIHQRLFVSIGWLLLGFVAVGAFLDAVSNAISLVTPRMSQVGTVVILAFWGGIEWVMRRGGAEWHVPGQQRVRLRRWGPMPRLAMSGSIVLLWIPWLVKPTADVLDGPRLRVELRLMIGGFEASVTNEGRRVAHDIVIDVAAWQAGSPGVEFRRSFQVRNLGPAADSLIERVFGTPSGREPDRPTDLFWRDDHGPISGYFVASCSDCEHPRAFAFYVPPIGRNRSDELEASKRMTMVFSGERSPWPLAEFEYPSRKPGIGHCVDFPSGVCDVARTLVWVASEIPNGVSEGSGASRSIPTKAREQ